MFLRPWLPPILWALVIFAGSSIPGSEIPRPVSVLSIYFHVSEYAVLGFFIARARGFHRRMPLYMVVFSACVMGLLYGISDELHQAFVPGRSMDSMDFIADAVGVGLGIVIWIFLRENHILKKRDTIV